MTYYAHFGLSGPPFELNAAAAEIFLGSEHVEAMAALEWGLIHEASGYTLLIGEPGVGKTTVACAALARHFGEMRTAFVAHPKLNFTEIATLISRQMGCELRGQGRLDILEGFGQMFHDGGSEARYAIIFDDAQALEVEIFEELRFFLDQWRAQNTEIRVVFIGQPELLEKLSKPPLKQMGERIGARVELKSLNEREIGAYIEYRLRLRGGRTNRIFTGRAIKSAITISRGVPRRANILCHNAMLQAFAFGVQRVTEKIVKTVASEYDGDYAVSHNHPLEAKAVENSRPKSLWLLTLGLIGVFCVLIWRFSGQMMTERATAVAQSMRDREDLITLPNAESSTKSFADAPVKHTVKNGVSSPLKTTNSIQNATAPRVADSLAIASGSRSSKSAQRNRSLAVRVAEGDTIGDLAVRYYGTRSMIDPIVQANPQIDDINRIYPGETVYLPVAELKRTSD